MIDFPIHTGFCSILIDTIVPLSVYENANVFSVFENAMKESLLFRDLKKVTNCLSWLPTLNFFFGSSF